ncbi:DUF551 domain-containing protein [Enterobacter kobei]|uniref:DUF551 domain-containing protein n=1 Tax=Enterobacter kobei TaxID=208224 RepID=UPI00374E1D5F
MSTISKERAELKSFITGFLSDPMHDDQSAKSMTAEVFRIALASLETEAVAWRSLYYENHGLLTGSKNVLASWQKQGWECEPLYSAPPAPVSDEDLLHMAASAIDDLLSNKDRSGAGVWADIPAKLRRAAMLQGAEPVTTAYKLPANTPCKDAPEHIWLQTAGVWPENGEFSELTWCSDNQHTDDTLYVRADVVTGNSPVIPDGWVLVPVEPTHEMLEAGDEQFGTYDVYRGMIAAAPQQEAKP